MIAGHGLRSNGNAIFVVWIKSTIPLILTFDRKKCMLSVKSALVILRENCTPGRLLIS